MKLELYTLQKNEKGEWGMWREYYKNGTACYWSKANPEQIRYLDGFSTERRKQKYIQEQKKFYGRLAIEPNHFNIFR